MKAKRRKYGKTVAHIGSLMWGKDAAVDFKI